MKATIFIDNLKMRAHHGVLQQERVVGADFLVSVRVGADIDGTATEGDCLEGTISYADLVADVRSEMSVPSNLLEHVVARIARRILSVHPAAKSVWVRIVKCNPPMGCELDGAGVEASFDA